MSTTTSTPIPRPARAARPPGPKGHWLRGHIGEFRADRLGFLTACARTYGDVVAIRLGPARIWVLNHPDLVEEVLVHQNRRFIKHFALRAATPTLGRGLLTSEGDFWRRQRRGDGDADGELHRAGQPDGPAAAVAAGAGQLPVQRRHAPGREHPRRHR